MKQIAVYLRVSSTKQDHRSQLPDLERWVNGQESAVVWYKDKASGKSMDRPAWKKLDADLRAGKISAVVCWRLDRLGRTCRGLATLFEELRQRNANLISLKE